MFAGCRERQPRQVARNFASPQNVLFRNFFRGSRAKVMVRFVVSREKLQERLLAELRNFPGCDGAQTVVVRRLTNRPNLINWEIIVFDSGTSDGVRCQDALAKIYAHSADRYEVVGA
jgi:hypothetical protein